MKNGKLSAYGLTAVALVAVGTPGGATVAPNLLAISEPPEASWRDAELVGSVECAVVEGSLGQVLECDKNIYLLQIPSDDMEVKECRLSDIEIEFTETDSGVEISAICQYDCGFSVRARAVRQ